MIRKRLKRGNARRPTKRLDLSDLRKALRDRRQWVCLGVVFKPEDAASHYELVTVDGNVVDIIVEVETIPDRLDLSCSLAGGFGGWLIPNVGDEVWVAVPSGEVAFRPTIIACTKAVIPNPTGQGPAPNRIVLVAGEVLVHDGTGGAEPVVRRSEFNGHSHAAGTYNAPGGGGAVTGTSGGAAAVAGSPVLKA